MIKVPYLMCCSTVFYFFVVQKKRMFFFLKFILFFHSLCLIQSDFNIYGAIVDSGEVIDASTISKYYSTCYDGFGFTHCKAKQADDDQVLVHTLPYYRDFYLLNGVNYCLQCCSSNSIPDDWNLECIQYTGVAPITNVYGYELRMARMLTLSDTEIIRCPIKRTACTYNESDPFEVIECSDDNTMLWGITVQFWITVRSINFATWRSVEQCIVTVDERTEQLPNGANFAENYILYHTVAPQKPSTFDRSLYSLFTLFCLYFLIYYFRTERCIICDKKLILFYQRCYLCRFYGAYPPDPLLMKAMEEKGSQLQGKYPSKFPGVRTCYNFFYGIYSIFKCFFQGILSIGQFIYRIFLCLCCCQWINYCRSSNFLCCKCCWKDKQIDPMLENPGTTTLTTGDPFNSSNVLELSRSHLFKSTSMNKINTMEIPEQEELINKSSKSHNNNNNNYDDEEEGLHHSKKRYASSKHSLSSSLVSSSNPTIAGGIKAPRRFKKNPNIIHVHPYFIYKALDHPHPPPPPKWVQQRRLDEGYQIPESVNDR